MIKIDLITGFLGSGKTTFLKKYAKYLLDGGCRVGILENDYGAVNVDVMLLQELEGENCGIETIAGACDRDCHQRRFKTKLIALAMSGYDRVIIEPSGIFDIDEFFDSLHEEPLDKWYEIGNVITIAEAGLENELSPQSEYLLASQCANAGKIILSRTQEVSTEAIQNTMTHINHALESIGCKRRFDNDIIKKDWAEFNRNDFEEIISCGYRNESFVKKFSEHSGYQSLYFMNTHINSQKAESIAKTLLRDTSFGDVFRVKGFINENEKWLELNATQKSLTLKPLENGQDIIIVIGENLNKDKINRFFGGIENENT